MSPRPTISKARPSRAEAAAPESPHAAPAPCSVPQRARRDHGMRPGRAARSPAASRTATTPSRSSTPTPTPSAGSGPSFSGTQGDRHRLRPGRAGRRPASTKADAFAAVSSGDNSNIIAARVARETFGIQQRRRPHLRPGPRRGLPAARHHHGRDRQVDRRPGAAPAAAGRRRARLPRPERHHPASTRSRSTSGGPASARSPSRSSPGAASPGSTGSARACSPTRDTRAAGGRHAAPGHARGERRARLRRVRAADRRPTDARRHRRGRRRRPVHRPRAHRERPQGAAHRQGARRRSTPSGCRRRSGCQADSCELSSLEEARLETCDVVIAATGDDKVNLVTSLLAKTEFAVPRTVGPGQPPEQRVALHRGVGRRRQRLDPAHHVGAGRGGRDDRRRRAALHVPPGQRQPRRDDAARRLAVHRHAVRPHPVAGELLGW